MLKGLRVQRTKCLLVSIAGKEKHFYQIQLLEDDPFTRCLSLYLLSFFIPSLRLPELDGLPEYGFSSEPFLEAALVRVRGRAQREGHGKHCGGKGSGAMERLTVSFLLRCKYVPSLFSTSHSHLLPPFRGVLVSRHVGGGVPT